MQPVRMYGVYDDGVDGRAPPKLCSVWTAEKEAHTRAGAYRSVRPVWMIMDPTGRTMDGYLLADPAPVKIGVDFDRERRRLREQALAKLDPAERLALGIAIEDKP